MKKIFFISLLFCLSSNLEASVFGNCEGQRARSRGAQLALLNPKFDLELIDFNLFSGTALVGGYEYEVEPAYTQGLFARTDRWYIGTDLTPLFQGGAGEAGEFNLNLGPRLAMRANFIRFDINACRAETLKPRSPRQMPLKARKALHQDFRRGEYFVFEASLGVSMTTEMLNLLTASTLGLNLEGEYLVEGSYQVHIVRLDQEHIRLKVLTRQGRSATAGLSVGPSTELEVFQISALDRALEKHLNPNPIRLKLNQSKSKVLVIDYTLKLSDPLVAQAFDKTLTIPKSIRDIHLAYPFSNDLDLNSQLILSLSELENLHREDQGNGRTDRIVRVLRAEGQQNRRGVELELGNKLLGFDFDVINATSKITLTDPRDVRSHYLLKSFERTHEGRIAFGWAQAFERRTTEVLLKSDPSFMDLDAMNVISVTERRDSKLSLREFEDIKELTRRALPREVFQSIPFGDWQQRNGEVRANVGFTLELIVGSDVVDSNLDISPQEMELLYSDYLKNIQLSANQIYSRTRQDPPEKRLTRSLNAVAQKLSYISQSTNSDLKRLEVFANLRRNNLFRQTGMGFLMKLTPQNSSYVKLDLSSSTKNLSFIRGDEDIARTYRNLQTVRLFLQTDNFDLRRKAERLTTSL